MWKKKKKKSKPIPKEDFGSVEFYCPKCDYTFPYGRIYSATNSNTETASVLFSIILLILIRLFIKIAHRGKSLSD